MKTKIFKSLLTIVCLLSSMSVLAQENSFMVDGIYYSLQDSEQICTVIKGAELYKGNITIPETVVYKNKKYTVAAIGEKAFEDCSNLTSVTIPNFVTSIGKDAFQDCKSLTSVTIPNSVTYIGEYTFYECSSLTNVTIPNSVTSIGEGAFQSCSSLTSVAIPNSVTSIGKDAFSNCSSLTSVIIPNSITVIGDGFFYGCSGLTNVTIPKSVKKIGSRVFEGCKALTTLYSLNTIPPTTSEYVSFSSEQYEKLKVFVLRSALAAYRQAKEWKKFKNLQGFDPK